MKIMKSIKICFQSNAPSYQTISILSNVQYVRGHHVRVPIALVRKNHIYLRICDTYHRYKMSQSDIDVDYCTFSRFWAWLSWRNEVVAEPNRNSRFRFNRIKLRKLAWWTYRKIRGQVNLQVDVFWFSDCHEM